MSAYERFTERAWERASGVKWSMRNWLRHSGYRKYNRETWTDYIRGALGGVGGGGGYQASAAHFDGETLLQIPTMSGAETFNKYTSSFWLANTVKLPAQPSLDVIPVSTYIGVFEQHEWFIGSHQVDDTPMVVGGPSFLNYRTTANQFPVGSTWKHVLIAADLS